MLQRDKAPVLETYKITDADQQDRYVEKIPEDYAEMAKMDWLGYRDSSEMLAERFHMDEDLLKALNPDVNWSKAGSEIIVASSGPPSKNQWPESSSIVPAEGCLLMTKEKNSLLPILQPSAVQRIRHPLACTK